MIDLRFKAERFSAGGILLDCAVTADARSIVFKKDAAATMGYVGKSQNWVGDFLLHLSRFVAVDADLLDRITSGEAFRLNGVETTDPITITDLMAFCETIVKAKDSGFLYVSELQFAKVAQSFLDDFDRSDWQSKINVASGYELFKQNQLSAVINIMKSKTLRSYPIWLKTIPENLLEIMLKLHEWSWTNNPDHAAIAEFMHNTVFARLSDGDLDALDNKPPQRKYSKAGMPGKYHPSDRLAQLYKKLEDLSLKSGNLPHFKLLLDKTIPKLNEHKFDWRTAPALDLSKFAAFEEKIAKALGPKPRY